MLPLAERLTSRVARAVDRLAASPATVLHGDMRLDNLFFPADAGAPPVVAVDWSNATRGPGPYDVAYFCCMAFTPEQRREHEDRLLHLYHDALLERGVTGYDFDACFDDYRLSFFEPFMRMFFLLVRGHAEKGTDRPRRVLARFVRHAAQAALDLNAGALIED
jgi:aminoglycoside/choline kinase family phosphotransferase